MSDEAAFPAPPITDEMREHAQAQPGTWLYCLDPYFVEAERLGQGVPPFGVIGAYEVDQSGEIRPDFVPNPNYRPSPISLGMTTPVNDIEQTLQLAATGYGTEDELKRALLTGTLLTARGPGGDSVMVVDEGEGGQAVRAYTSERYVPEQPVDPSRWQRVQVPNLLPLLQGRHLSLNPGTELAVRIPGTDLASA
jgi:hypothetical protein